MNEHDAATAREPILSPMDRVSEMLFGLFMALTFVGAVSIADSGRNDIQDRREVLNNGILKIE